jgi:hypothetical protein
MLRQVLIQLGVDPDDDAALRWAVAVRAAHLLWRNTVLEDWHAAGRLHDGEMMRNNSAVVKLIRFYLDPAKVRTGTRSLLSSPRQTDPSRTDAPSARLEPQI